MGYSFFFISTRLCGVGVLALLSACSTQPVKTSALDKIEHIVVIYGENRSFDNLYGLFPGAEGIANPKTEIYPQRDRDGSILAQLPPVWIEKSDKPDPAYPLAMANQPFRIDLPPVNKALNVTTRDLVHRYYQNIEQIHGGKNDQFAAYSDAGGLVMGHYDAQQLPLFALAKEFTLADHFFMGAYGGSFLNHFWLACACTPAFPDAPDAMKAKLDADGKLLRKPESPASALQGPVQWLKDGSVTPDGFAVNTVQPPYQPSGIAPATDKALADASKNPLPPQTQATIGDRLSDKGISWAWYAGAWNQALTDSVATSEHRGVIYSGKPGSVNFQPHHQPYNYFKRYAPGTQARAEHLKDGTEFMQAIENGRLPQVAFYKPNGDLNEHPGYTDVLSGDQHIADLVEKIRRSPQWRTTAIIITYDENGGFWDHVAPRSGQSWSDRWGPATRIPAIIVSPLAKKGFVDATPYDTTSILKLITRRFGLEPLPGVREKAGDLTNAFE